MRFEILPGLPPYGPTAVSFTKNGQSEHREGLVVRFFPKIAEPWVGNFIGGVTRCNAVLEHPNEIDFVIVAAGEVHILDIETKSLRRQFGWDIEDVFVLSTPKALIFRSTTDFEAILADDSGWRSPRISWDGFRNIGITGTQLYGEAYTPIDDDWVPFKLDLLTGYGTDAIYQVDQKLGTSP